MEYNIIFLIIIFYLFGLVYNGDQVSELSANEETESECYLTQPQSKQDCYEKEVDEDDDYCCFFEIENHKKENIVRCGGLTEFQYGHIKLYVKEKMDELLYRDLKIDCHSEIIKNKFIFSFIFFLCLILCF